MPSIRSLASKRRACVIAVILLLSEIMPTYSRYVLKGLVYIAIIALLGRQPFSYAKYAFFIYFCVLQSLQLLYLICLRVLF